MKINRFWANMKNPRELLLMEHSDIAFYYTREVTNGYLSTARGSAAAINFNVALILFPVCRNLVSFARNLFPGSQLKKIFDANIKDRVFINHLGLCPGLPLWPEFSCPQGVAIAVSQKRATKNRPSFRKLLNILNKAHKLISYVLLFWTVVHILAHYLNIYNFSDSWARIYWFSKLEPFFIPIGRDLASLGSDGFLVLHKREKP